jgi:F-type H+/Na+-transporting ATPase subunit alpha
MNKIAAGEWDDSTEEELGRAIAEAIDDFGPDFDEEGNPLEEGESDRIMSEEERQKEGRTSGSQDGGGDSSEDETTEQESETAPVGGV